MARSHRRKADRARLVQPPHSILYAELGPRAWPHNIVGRHPTDHKHVHIGLKVYDIQEATVLRDALDLFLEDVTS